MSAKTRKKALLFLYALEHGGHSVTAVELAAAIQAESNWEPVIFGSPGKVADLARERGLRVVLGRPDGIGISPRDMRGFAQVCRDERPDLVHAWDWRPVFNAYYSAHLSLGIPLLGSVTAMYPPTILPPDITVSFVTEDIRSHDSRKHPRNFVLPPPINTDQDNPAIVDPSAFRAAHGLDDDTVHIVIVSRLARAMKLDGILRAIDATDELANDFAVDLVVVGDGDSADEVRAAATRVNDTHGQPIVKLTGAMDDPRPAYAAADITVAMGTSSNRAMAFAKPVVVVGEDGFAETFERQTSARLIDAGFYGFGPGPGPNPMLRKQLEELVRDPTRRQELGAYGRDVVQQFSVTPIARMVAGRYDAIARDHVSRAPWRVGSALVRVAGVGCGYQLKSLVPARLRQRFWLRHERTMRQHALRVGP